MQAAVAALDICVASLLLIVLLVIKLLGSFNVGLKEIVCIIVSRSFFLFSNFWEFRDVRKVNSQKMMAGKYFPVFSSFHLSYPFFLGKRAKKPLPKFNIAAENSPPVTPPRDLDKRTNITIGDRVFEVEADDLETLGLLGQGAYGIVEKMKHKNTGTIMAVKVNMNIPFVLYSDNIKTFVLQRIPVTVNTQEQKRLLTDLDVSMRTADCPYTVTFYGALFREGDVWICMECMDTSLDKFYVKAYNHGKSIDEDVLGQIAFAVLHFFTFSLGLV